MELSLVLDPPTTTAVDAKAPGTDPNDNASQAFASLLAALVGGLAPQPTPIPVAVPVDASTPTAPALVAAAAPSATPTDVPATTGPAGPAALALPELVPFSSRQRPDGGRDGDQKASAPTPVPLVRAAMAPPMVPLTPVAIGTDEPEPDPIEVVPDAPTAPAPKAAAPVTTHPSAGAPTTAVTPDVAPIAFSSPERPDGGRHGDQKQQQQPERAPMTVAATTDAPRDAAVLAAKPFAVHAPSTAAASTSPAPTTPASPVEQVVRAVAPLRKLADGTHRVVLELHPAELGTVRVELSLDAGTVHLGLHADTEATSHLLHAALPELRSQLDAAGLAAGRLAVDAGGTGRRGGQGLWQTAPDRPRRRATANATDGVDELVPTGVVTAEPGHVDVLL